MKPFLVATAMLLLSGFARAAPTVYTDEAAFLAELAAIGGPIVYESFEDDVVWTDSRNSIPSPGSTPSVASQGLLWTSNHVQNEIATGTVGGSAPDGAFALYSLPHGQTTDSGLYCDSAEDPDIPVECYQNDGLAVRSEGSAQIVGFGGHFDTANAGKVTFLVDGFDVNGNDSDNVDNWQREGDLADGWAFVGVIDSDGFSSVEVRELRGKDYQQVLLFADDFIVGTLDSSDGDGDGVPSFLDNCLGVANPSQPDFDRDGYGDRCDPDYGNDEAVGISDFNTFRAQFGRITADPGFDPRCDHDGDGVIGLPDFNVLRSYFGGPPGPSGLICAGTAPCPAP